MKNEQIKTILNIILIVLVVGLSIGGYISKRQTDELLGGIVTELQIANDYRTPDSMQSFGVTNFDSLELDSGLNVGGALDVTGATTLAALTAATLTGSDFPIKVGGHTFTSTGSISISGVLTNVILLYEQQ